MQQIVQEVQEKYSYLGELFKKFWKSCTKFNSLQKQNFRNTKWKNEKAKPGCAYEPTQIEQFANIITHGIWIIPALLASLKLFERSTTNGQFMVSWVYGGTLTLIFFVSTFFHCSCYCKKTNIVRNILHRCDRAMIYVFIAGSYFPWLQLGSSSPSLILSTMEWVIWLLAAAGITYQQIFHERFKFLETCFYIIMGLGPALIILLTGHRFNGLTYLKLGGFFYILGIYFFKSDGLIPMAHAIWHLFVVAAAGCHYYAILVNLYPTNL